MPPPQIFSLTGHAFGLTVSGVQVIQKVPTDLYPLRWEMPSATNNGGIDFIVLDEGETSLPAGAVVRLTDNVNNELLFSGPLVNRRFARHGGPYRRVECSGVGWGFYLDNRVVSEWSWASGTDDIHTAEQMIELFGGPLLASSSLIYWPQSVPAAGTATKTTLRGALEMFHDATDVLGNALILYADNERQVHWSIVPSWEADNVGTATSIGDQGALLPESLSYELGDEAYKGWAYAYDTGGAAIGIATNGGGWPDWEAGEPSTTYDLPIDLTNPLDAGAGFLRSWHGQVTSITFSTTESTDFRPHQEITVDDSLLTGGTAETWYIEEVSGAIDHRNVIEMRVSIGARSRSIVQTVATP